MTNKSKLFKVIMEGQVNNYTNNIFKRFFQTCFVISTIGLLGLSLIEIIGTIPASLYAVLSLFLIILMTASNTLIDRFK